MTLKRMIKQEDRNIKQELTEITVLKRFCVKLEAAIKLLSTLGHCPEKDTLQNIYDHYFKLIKKYEMFSNPKIPTVLNQMHPGKKFKELNDTERKAYITYLARIRRAKKKLVSQHTNTGDVKK
jgi:hypothetical protein